jgi:GT2 family glycosyltransferase
MNQIAVLLTCFNRKQNTLKCLQQLFYLQQDIDVYLVDDGSSDGTKELVAEQFPQVNLIKGSGDLFWNRGMHLAWQEAAKKDYNYYLWLNDDVVLYENCFEELLACVQLKNDKAIISGIIESLDQEILYGGTNENKQLIIPNGKLNSVANMNGNVVLISKQVYDVLGNLDPYFHHDLGDVDYGWRAIENEIGVFTTRVAIASGEKNDFCRVRLNNSTLPKRFKKLYSPLGSNPSINFYSKRMQYGIFKAAVYYLFLHFINVIPDKMNEKIFGKRYQ